ncbi:unnamed protein product [Microthlaspi erraticum]|uniref:Uncharacterized protein n=1 Tax=Microthlaspi erraticum TaxID=1685480 RepID=A0A6D2HJA9_9BRAS|nr:unnamed protein product [Microthlaspi erraticum]
MAPTRAEIRFVLGGNAVVKIEFDQYTMSSPVQDECSKKRLVSTASMLSQGRKQSWKRHVQVWCPALTLWR